MAATAVKDPDRRVHDALLSALEPIQPKGISAVTGLLPAELKPNDPGLTISGIGAIQLPLPGDSVQTLVDWSYALVESSKQKTRASKDYRFRNKNKKACGIAPQHITFANDTLWRTHLDSMISKVHHTLSLKEDQRIVVEPFKLSIHRPGDTISSLVVPNANADTGTLLVCFPTAHKGESILFSLAEGPRKFETHSQSSARFRFIAWNNGPMVEFMPITSGVRIVMVYRIIILNNDNSRPTGHLELEHVQQLEAALKLWDTGNEKHVQLQLLAYKLQEEQVSKTNIYLSLCANDLARVHALKDACDRTGIRIFLGNLRKIIRCDSMISNDDIAIHKESGTLPDIDHRDIVQHLQMITHVQDLEGFVTVQKAFIHEEEIVQKNIFIGKPNNFSMFEDYHNEDGLDSETEWTVQYNFDFPVILLLPQRNLAVLKVRHWLTDMEQLYFQDIKGYLDDYLNASRGWVQAYEPPTDIDEICEILINHNDTIKPVAGREDPQVLRVDGGNLQKLAIVTAERGSISLFHQVCKQITKIRNPETLVNFLALNLLQTGEFAKVDFWVSTQTSSVQKIKSSSMIETAFVQAKCFMGFINSGPNIKAWRLKWFRQALGEFDSSEKLNSNDFAILLQAYDEIRHNESEMQTLITQRAEDLRNPSYLCSVLEQCYGTKIYGYCFISSHLDAIVEAILAAGGSLEWQSHIVTSLFQLTKRLGPVGMVSLVPLFRPMTYNLGFILHFLSQDFHVNFPGDNRLPMAFKKEIVEPAIAQLSFTKDTVHAHISTVNQLKSLASRLRSFRMGDCIPVLMEKLKTLPGLDIEQFKFIFTDLQWKEFGKDNTTHV